MKLSLRLQMIADMVKECNTMADVGTDHGWIPIYLVLNNKVNHAIAMDIAEGPLERARQHISSYDLNCEIECRLSDGINGLAANEADTAVIAGMGGDLIARIINDNPDKVNEIIVSPHTHSELVRHALIENGYKIIDEATCFDSDKYYVVIKAVKGTAEEYTEEEFYFGPELLKKKDEILYVYLLKKKEQFMGIFQKKEFIELIDKALEHFN